MGTPLPEIPGGWSEQNVVVGSRSFLLTLPADPDAFLDDPAVLEANRLSGLTPYWSYLWPSSMKMARLICESTMFAQDRNRTSERTLEIGSGIGLVGIAGLATGFDVTFSDYDDTSVQLAQHNAVHNGFVGCPAVRLDWREIDETLLNPFSVILGCDVVYETPNHSLVLSVLDRLLDSTGVCWIGDPGRGALSAFTLLAEEWGFAVSLFGEDGEEVATLGDQRFVVNEFRLLRLRRSSL